MDPCWKELQIFSTCFSFKWQIHQLEISLVVIPVQPNIEQARSASLVNLLKLKRDTKM